MCIVRNFIPKKCKFKAKAQDKVWFSSQDLIAQNTRPVGRGLFRLRRRFHNVNKKQAASIIWTKKKILQVYYLAGAMEQGHR